MVRAGKKGMQFSGKVLDYNVPGFRHDHHWKSM